MEMISVALPKGRLGEKVYAQFKAAGYPCPSIEEENHCAVVAARLNPATRSSECAVWEWVPDGK